MLGKLGRVASMDSGLDLEVASVQGTPHHNQIGSEWKTDEMLEHLRQARVRTKALTWRGLLHPTCELQSLPVEPIC